jgi:hypothetical protein
MKTSVLALVLSLTATVSVSAFAPAPTFTRSVVKGTSHLFAEPPEEEEEGFDLDLGEMFQMWVYSLNSASIMWSCISLLFWIVLTLLRLDCWLFNRFEAADKEKNFDATVKKVKGGKKEE